MKIAVTGASGLIGTALSQQLRADGHTVVPVVRTAAGPDAIAWDPMAGTIETAKLEGIDAVVHLAGAGIGDKRWSDAYKKTILDSRVKGTEVLTTALASLQNKPSVLISGSAIGYYGATGNEAVTESAPAGNDFLADVCVQWENAAAPAQQAGIRTVFLRTGIVLSPKGGALKKMLPLFKLGVGGKMGSGRQWWSWISMDDEIGLIQHLLNGAVNGPVNATAPNPVTNSEMTKALGKALHRPTIAPVPSFGPKLLLGSELAEALLFTSAKVLPAAAQAAGYQFKHSTIEDAFAAMFGANAATKG